MYLRKTFYVKIFCVNNTDKNLTFNKNFNFTNDVKFLRKTSLRKFFTQKFFA